MALKPYWIKKFNLGMTGDEVKEALQGGGGGSVYPEIKIKFTTESISSGEVPAHSILGIIDSDQTPYAILVTRESFILPENGEVNCSNDLIFLSPVPFDPSHVNVSADFIEDLNQRVKTITGAIKPVPDSDIYYLYDKTEISIQLSLK